MARQQGCYICGKYTFLKPYDSDRDHCHITGKGSHMKMATGTTISCVGIC